MLLKDKQAEAHAEKHLSNMQKYFQSRKQTLQEIIFSQPAMEHKDNSLQSKSEKITESILLRPFFHSIFADTEYAKELQPPDWDSFVCFAFTHQKHSLKKLLNKNKHMPLRLLEL